MGEPFVTMAQKILAEAHGLKALPTDYADVTQGFMARWKRLLKQKVLNNFRRAYIDVLSRQQSAFNERVLTALAQLADCCSALGHASRQSDGPAAMARLQEQLRKVRRRERRLQKHVEALERRLSRMERALQAVPLAVDEPVQDHP